MICPSCGQETDDQNQFCSKCGAPTATQQTSRQAGATGQPEPPPPPPGMQQEAQPSPPAPSADQGAPGNEYSQPQGSQPPQQQPQVAPPVPEQYVQPTIQMPAAQTAPAPGTYQQPAYGQGPYAQQQPGQYAQPGQPYQPAVPGAPQYAQPYAPVATGKRGSTVLGLISLIMGGVMIGSTFLAWVSASAFGSSVTATGWDYLRGASGAIGGSNLVIVLTGNGVVFFTGFFSLLLGLLIMVFSIVMFFRRRIGGVIVFIFALVATGVAAVDVAMVFSKMPGGSPGVGLWMFVGAAFVALILGIVGLASSGG